MTAHRDLKSIIRERQLKTGESYTAARAHVIRARAQLLGIPEPSPCAAPHQPLDAIVLSVGDKSVRVRIPEEGAELTFRSGRTSEVVPGHVVKLAVRKRWT